MFLIHYVKTFIAGNVFLEPNPMCSGESQTDSIFSRFFKKASMDPPLYFWVCVIGICQVMQTYLVVKMFQKQSWTQR